MKKPIIYAALLAPLTLWGCKEPASQDTDYLADYPELGSCELLAPSSLRLSGPIDAAMRDCALALLGPDITTVHVTSKGGDVSAGREIGYAIGAQPRELIIEGLCMSSCGNYFVPAAARLTLRPRSIIGLHGSPDPHMLSNVDMEKHMASMVANGDTASEGVARILKRKSERRERQLLEEAKFAARFNVPKGWRHYREAGDTDDGWRRHFTTGSDAGVTPDKFMIVEGPMLESCLPHVETKTYQATLNDTVLEQDKYWTSLKEKIGAYRSRNLLCK